MNKQLVFQLIITTCLSILASGVAIKISKKFRLTTGSKNVPGLGGLAIIIVWWICAYYFGFIKVIEQLPLLVATVLIAVIGTFDVKKALGPWPQLITQVSAALIAVIFGGIAIKYVTNPFGGTFDLSRWEVLGITFGAVLTIIWVVTLMNVVNFLDGVDGLASTVSTVGFIAIGLVSLLPQVSDDKTAALAFIGAASILGFLFWNLTPAALYLGTAGSWFIGFILAIIAVQGASKIATTAVVGAVPLLDAISVVIGRIRRGHSPFRGDRTHLHHKLQRRGLSGRSILLLYLFSSILLGLSAVKLQTNFKIIIFLLFSLIFAFLIVIGSKVVKRKVDRGNNIIKSIL